MAKNDLDDKLKKELNFLIRYLKEHGVYRKYRYYIYNSYYHNAQTLPGYQSLSFFEILKKHGSAREAISWPIHWRKTDEKDIFWCKLHMDFKKLFDLKFR